MRRFLSTSRFRGAGLKVRNRRVFPPFFGSSAAPPAGVGYGLSPYGTGPYGDPVGYGFVPYGTSPYGE